MRYLLSAALLIALSCITRADPATEARCALAPWRVSHARCRPYKDHHETHARGAASEPSAKGACSCASCPAGGGCTTGECGVPSCASATPTACKTCSSGTCACSCCPAGGCTVPGECGSPACILAPTYAPVITPPVTYRAAPSCCPAPTIHYPMHPCLDTLPPAPTWTSAPVTYSAPVYTPLPVTWNPPVSPAPATWNATPALVYSTALTSPPVHTPAPVRFSPVRAVFSDECTSGTCGRR